MAERGEVKITIGPRAKMVTEAMGVVLRSWGDQDPTSEEAKAKILCAVRKHESNSGKREKSVIHLPL